MTTAPGSALDERYGRRAGSPRRRRLVWAGAAAAVALAVAGLVWLALLQARPVVTSRLLGWDVDSPSTVSVRAEVTLREGVPATCFLQARASDSAVVGRVSVTVPAGAQRQVLLDQRIVTERPAAAAELVGCTASGQARPR